MRAEPVDKEAVRQDFLRGYSTRQLALKYGVSKSAVARWVQKYGWKPEARAAAAQAPPAEEQGRQRTKSDGGAASAPQTELPEDPAFQTLRRYTDKVLDKADQLLNLEEPLSPRDLKSLSSMLLDIRQLIGILSPREAAEQELRLSALRKQAEAAESGRNAGVTVVFEGVSDDAAV